eukprot:8109703-Pyramimonas_sp.AAC.1
MASSRDAEARSRLAILVQPPRVRTSDGTSVLCTPLPPSDRQMTTTGLKARNKHCEGCGSPGYSP